MKIIVLDRCTVVNENDIDFSAIDKLGDVEYYDVLPKTEIIEKLTDADAVICNKAIIDSVVMDKAKKLRYIGLFATGYNNIDIEYAKKKGITVCNAPNYSTNAVAQLTFSLLLNLAGKTDSYTKFVRDGKWIYSPVFSCFPYSMTEIYGKTFGIYGLGTIGQAVAKIALAFGMKVKAYSRTKKQVDGVEFVNEEELFRRSDFLSFHCALTPDTAEKLNKNTLSLMKNTAFVINTSRGGVINEQDLADALKNGKIAGAGLDVLVKEPMSEDCPLRNIDNCIITSHIGWAPKETRERLIDIVAENIECFKKGTPINDVTK